jgi:tRNA dimethylallyltransferase
LYKELTNKTIIIIAGPTAVGKTSVAIKLAKKLNCDIISADSRQVYIEMNIGTAKPDKIEMEGIKHHFINNVSVTDNYDVGKYAREVNAFLEEYFTEKDIVIMTGGTGLYIEAAIWGLDDFPDIDKDIKSGLIKICEQKGVGELQKMLKNVDPVYYAKVDLNNPHRLIRALSVFQQTNIPYSAFLKQFEHNSKYKTINILLQLNREVLYDRINKRVDIMIKNGLVDEVGKLYEYKDLKALNTVGYKELFAYLDDKTSLDEAILLIKRNSRRYAKRQMTWFNNRGNWNVFSPDDIEDILRFIT